MGVPTLTIGDEIRVTIERLTEGLRRSPLLGLASAGRLPPHALGLYLESLRYLFVQSQQNLQLASEDANLRGDLHLSAVFSRKAAEERGHDAWALRDLAQLPATALQGVQPANAIVRLAELQRTLLARNALCFFAYTLWAEYFTVLVGDEWIQALGRSGYTPEQISAVANHVVADRDHAHEGFEALNELWTGDPSRAELRAAVTEAAREFEKFCDEVYACASHVV